MRRRTKYKEDYMQYIEVSYFDKLPGNLNKSSYVSVSLSVYLTFWNKKNISYSFTCQAYTYQEYIVLTLMLQLSVVQFMNTFCSIIPRVCTYNIYMISQNTFLDEKWTKTTQYISCCEKCKFMKKAYCTCITNLQYSFDLYGCFVIKLEVEGNSKL